jgi:hypothetical protein
MNDLSRPRLIPFDEPAPAIFADGLRGVGRRGWQYAVIGGTTLLPPGLIPREGSAVDSVGELEAVRAYERDRRGRE